MGNDRGSVVAQGALGDLPGMHAGAVDRAVKQLLEADEPVAVVEEQACEYLVLMASQAGGEKAAGVGGTAQRCVAAQPALEITTPELQARLQQHFPEIQCTRLRTLDGF